MGEGHHENLARRPRPRARNLTDRSRTQRSIAGDGSYRRPPPLRQRSGVASLAASGDVRRSGITVAVFWHETPGLRTPTLPHTSRPLEPEYDHRWNAADNRLSELGKSIIALPGGTLAAALHPNTPWRCQKTPESTGLLPFRRHPAAAGGPWGFGWVDREA